MLRRVPPALLALGATVVLLAVVVGVFAALGGGNDRPVGTCDAALEAGPYGCTVFVSVRGAVGGQEAAEPSGGAVTVRIEQDGDGALLRWSAGCGGGTAPVVVTPTRWRLGGVTRTGTGCDGTAAEVDAWAAALLQGAVRVDDRDDATVELARGGRSALFAQAIAARP